MITEDENRLLRAQLACAESKANFYQGLADLWREIAETKDEAVLTLMRGEIARIQAAVDSVEDRRKRLGILTP